MRKAIFAGTFDPPTLGHRDTVEQAAQIFDEVTVAVLVNPAKTPMFSEAERREMLSILCADIPNVRIIGWQGVAVDLLRAEGTRFYVRGIRNTIDLEYETADFYASCKLYPELITVYLPARQEHLHISSTLAKNSIYFSKPVEECVGEEVAEYIKGIMRARETGE